MIELNSEIIVEDLEDKVRLDVFLAEETGWTRSQIKLQIENDRVLVNGKKQKAGFLIKNGDLLSVSFSKDAIEINAEAENIPLDVVYEGIDYDRQLFFGRSVYHTPEADALVLFKSKIPVDIGKIYKVKITDYLDYDLKGELLWISQIKFL